MRSRQRRATSSFGPEVALLPGDAGECALLVLRSGRLLASLDRIGGGLNITFARSRQFDPAGAAQRRLSLGDAVLGFGVRRERVADLLG
jgi:hypothetical protein